MIMFQPGCVAKYSMGRGRGPEVRMANIITPCQITRKLEDGCDDGAR
jgi:hypothetical protein